MKCCWSNTLSSTAWPKPARQSRTTTHLTGPYQCSSRTPRTKHRAKVTRRSRKSPSSSTAKPTSSGITSITAGDVNALIYRRGNRQELRPEELRSFVVAEWPVSNFLGTSAPRVEVNIPNDHLIVSTAGNQFFAVLTKGHRIHVVIMAQQSAADRLACPSIPEVDRLLAHIRSQNTAVVIERNLMNVASVYFDFGVVYDFFPYLAPRRDIPNQNVVKAC